MAAEKASASLDDFSTDEKVPASATATSIEDEKAPPLAIPHNDGPGLGLWNAWRNNGRDLDDIATQPSVFDDPSTLEAYRPPPQYENAHRFDPLARWTWREEKVRSSFLDTREC